MSDLVLSENKGLVSKKSSDSKPPSPPRLGCCCAEAAQALTRTQPVHAQQVLSDSNLRDSLITILSRLVNAVFRN